MERAAVRWLRVLLSVMPACSMGMAMNSTLPQYFLRAAMRGEYFYVLFMILLSQPKPLHNPIFTRMRVHYVLLTDVGYEEGEFGTPLHK